MGGEDKPDSKFQLATLDQSLQRLWQSQVLKFACSGAALLYVWFLDRGPGKRVDGVQTEPPDRSHPRILSRLHTLGNESKTCSQAFPSGRYFTVPKLSNVTAINALQGFHIEKDELAIIDGESMSMYSHSRTPPELLISRGLCSASLCFSRVYPQYMSMHPISGTSPFINRSPRPIEPMLTRFAQPTPGGP